MKLKLALSLVVLGSVPAAAQDPLKVAPQAYKLTFENEWVRVIEVNYGPKEKVAAHDHTAFNAAFVYLNDSGPVVFNHLDTDYTAVTRAPTKAGSFRVYYGLPESHEVINTSDLPSRFLRVEFKTVPKGSLTLKGKFPREEVPPGETVARVQLDHDQVRVSRLVVAPKSTLTITAAHTEPALLIALVAADLGPSGGSKAVKLSSGQAEFLATGASRDLRNAGSAPAEFLRFDFKTPPMSKDALEKVRAQHAHPKAN